MFVLVAASSRPFLTGSTQRSLFLNYSSRYLGDTSSRSVSNFFCSTVIQIGCNCSGFINLVIVAASSSTFTIRSAQGSVFLTILPLLLCELVTLAAFLICSAALLFESSATVLVLSSCLLLLRRLRHYSIISRFSVSHFLRPVTVRDNYSRCLT